MEKSLGSAATSGGGDSGVSSRMFGSIISWLSMKNCPAFLIGTLNNFQVLPSELIRRGRFDQVFWVDLPTSEERVSVFNALLEYRFKRNVRVTIDSPVIAATVGFSGAEIEALLEESLYDVLLDTTLDADRDVIRLAEAKAADMTPQSVLEHTALEQLREKAQSFTPATTSTESKSKKKRSARPLNLN